ncbi:NAD-binding oxidoreductase [Echinicola strongylocentroti]|uniref:NAD-binding oxidoreductase n=1 Tax=Echinicola strongylocentroti TaxID=1795355 RepID=A0A2Z4IIS2_9BACT|nr:oxidoreductase [Echinicola strongylocentroti]AWW30795.1 NAD-binding oxidoreductase [Echinicola strongylocentroti]
MTQPLKTGLVGFGKVAQTMHAPLIHQEPLLDLTAVVERHREASKEKYPEVTVYKSLEELLDKAEVDLIVICTPNEQHFPQAKMALEAGKHVVVDKPITVTSAEAETLQAVAQEQGKLLSVFQNRRWDGDFMTISKLLNEGVLGNIVHFESHFDRFRPEPNDNWREKDVPGSGILYDLGAHLIDQALLLFGKPSWVYAEILQQRKAVAADDFFDLTLMYPETKVRLTASILMNAPLPKFLVLGDKGSFSKYGLDVQEAAFKAGVLPGSEDWGVEDADAYGKVFLEGESFPYPTENGNYLAYYENIAQAIRGVAPLKVSPREAIETLKIIEAARQSHAEGKRIYL